MAKGLNAAVGRFHTIIEGCDSTAGWVRSAQRISSMMDPNLLPGAIEHKYWVVGKERDQRPAVQGNLVTTNNMVVVELARHFGGGDRLGRDHSALHRSLEAEGNIVEQSLLHPNNWDISNTGIILVNMDKGEVIELENIPVLLWKAEFEVMIRQAQVAVVV